MADVVRKHILTIRGCDGSRIGVGIGGPVARLDIGRKGHGLRFSGKNVGIGVWNTPTARLEVRSDGAGVGRKG
jgi:hypothetical protein